MSTPDPLTQRPVSVLVTVVGALGAFLIIAALVVYMQRQFRPAPVGAARAEERLKISTALRSENADALANYGVVKADNGIYRLPVEQALTLWAGFNQEGNAAGRAKLIERLEASLKQVSYE
ncbi:MAG: hypothetical protein KIT22_00155 [Verrucomicrobiae bacterium]|nr:hypothetical protein [Verrucomicrobiae bacterium]